MRKETAHASRAEEVVAAHREYMLQSLTTLYQEPLVLEEGSGSRVCSSARRRTWKPARSSIRRKKSSSVARNPCSSLTSVRRS